MPLHAPEQAARLLQAQGQHGRMSPDYYSTLSFLFYFFLIVIILS